MVQVKVARYWGRISEHSGPLIARGWVRVRPIAAVAEAKRQFRTRRNQLATEPANCPVTE